MIKLRSSLDLILTCCSRFFKDTRYTFCVQTFTLCALQFFTLFCAFWGVTKYIKFLHKFERNREFIGKRYFMLNVLPASSYIYQHNPTFTIIILHLQSLSYTYHHHPTFSSIIIPLPASPYSFQYLSMLISLILHLPA